MFLSKMHLQGCDNVTSCGRCDNARQLTQSPFFVNNGSVAVGDLAWMSRVHVCFSQNAERGGVVWVPVDGSGEQASGV